MLRFGTRKWPSDCKLQILGNPLLVAANTVEKRVVINFLAIRLYAYEFGGPDYLLRIFPEFINGKKKNSSRDNQEMLLYSTRAVMETRTE